MSLGDVIPSSALDGGGGAVYISDATTTVAPAGSRFIAFTALDASTIDVSGTEGTIDAAIPVPKGTTVFGRWSSLKFAAGAKVLAYKG